MCAGADSIDDLDVLRAGGMPILFNGVYAPSTLGTLLREFTFGHARQLESVLREHLVALTRRADVLTGLDQQAFIDIDSLLRPVYGHAKQGASYGHTKIAGKQVLRKGLSPLATTLSTPTAAPVIAGMRLRAGKTGSGKGAGRMIAQAITTARATGASGKILVRGDSAFGTRTVVRACRRGNAEFSLVLTKNRAVQRAIDSIADTQWTPVRYPGAVHDPDTGGWISEAEVAEVPYTAFAATGDRITARLVVRRVKDARHPDALFPVWRYHPFFTNSTLPTVEADIVHRRHAIIETVFADLIDGPLAHMPSGSSERTPPGCSAPQSPTTCSTPPERWPAGATPSPEAPPSADRSSPCRLDWPDPHDNPSCTYPPAGPGRRPGSNSGTTSPATAHHLPPPDPPADTGPSAPNSGRAGQTSSLHTHTNPRMINSGSSAEEQDHQPGCSVDRG